MSFRLKPEPQHGPQASGDQPPELVGNNLKPTQPGLTVRRSQVASQAFSPTPVERAHNWHVLRLTLSLTADREAAVTKAAGQ